MTFKTLFFKKNVKLQVSVDVPVYKAFYEPLPVLNVKVEAQTLGWSTKANSMKAPNPCIARLGISQLSPEIFDQSIHIFYLIIGQILDFLVSY